MSVRRIDQIAASTGSDKTPDILYALCSDGTVWYLKIWGPDLTTGDWKQLPSIPRSASFDANLEVEMNYSEQIKQIANRRERR